MPEKLPITYNNFHIPTFTSKDQIINSSYVVLGMDTELVIKKSGARGKTLWPHELGLPQERKPTDERFSFRSPSGSGTAPVNDTSPYAIVNSMCDFHGDGYATELCISTAICIEVLMSDVGGSLLKLHEIAGDSKISVATPAVYRVPKPVSDAAPEDVKRLGCSPSLNVYDDCGDPSILSDGMRTTGCHLHMTHPTLQDPTTAYNLVRWADILVGCAWVLVSPENPKMEILRRKAYGRAGEFRYRNYTEVYGAIPAAQRKDYNSGVEYRVLPGTVLRHPTYLSLMFNLYRSALRAAITQKTPDERLSMAAREAINGMDRGKAEWVLSHMPFSGPVLDLLSRLAEEPLEELTPQEWKDRSWVSKGFAKWYNEEVHGKAV